VSCILNTVITGPVVKPVTYVIAFDSLQVFYNVIYIWRTEPLSCDFTPSSVYWLWLSVVICGYLWLPINVVWNVSQDQKNWARYCHKFT